MDAVIFTTCACICLACVGAVSIVLGNAIARAICHILDLVRN